MSTLDVDHTQLVASVKPMFCDLGAQRPPCGRWSAERGQTAARNNLAYLYRNGLGVPPDSEKARFWYGKAAADGYVDAGVVFEAMSRPDLLDLSSAASAADRSMLVALTQMTEDEAVDSELVTSRDSTNDRLWPEFCELRWMMKLLNAA